jgi:hypothetical protein
VCVCVCGCVHAQCCMLYCNIRTFSLVCMYKVHCYCQHLVMMAVYELVRSLRLDTNWDIEQAN